MTSRTSLIISGSSAEVGSSKSITLGRIASARAIAARCCWPPDSWAGYFSAWLAMPTRSRSSIACCSASAAPSFLTFVGPRVTFCRIVLCANRLNDWKTMPTSARSWASSLPSSGSGCPSIRIVPPSIGSEPVDRAAERGLATARRADHDDDLASVDRQVDVLQDVQFTEVLVDVLEYDERSAAAHVGLRWPRCRCRSWPQSVRHPKNTDQSSGIPIRSRCRPLPFLAVLRPA